MLGMFIYYHFYPTIYWLQLIYYIFATFILLLGLSWFTSALTVYIRDVSQFVGMVLQFAFWLTPIFWSIERVPEQYQWLIKLNPLFYIIEGYRNSLIYHKWFWEDINLTIYFWVVTLFIFIIGGLTFKRLRPYFADVL
jgi:lipopolysaccharide transport system permease protein/teichoic acid transport system permease protein